MKGQGQINRSPREKRATRFGVYIAIAQRSAKGRIRPPIKRNMIQCCGDNARFQLGRGLAFHRITPFFCVALQLSRFLLDGHFLQL
jgi:hypothetical protein